MKKNVRIKFCTDKFGYDFFLIIIYNRYKYKQYIIDNNLLYTFFLIIFFLYKYGFVKTKVKV